ncbi:sorting nexin-22 isoform X2 [Anarrhichthys ocellatus]|uniref:sorting nexin-22 isoform X2 n=1 Tax=Anarrhichthys ocellatus TaxID=433405 RepID=UPI0012EEA66B|nr:sorting nexin-24-like isoform X2 [Anarrhichthys ocellatus]
MVWEEDFPMIEVSIPSMEREVDESGKTRKRFRVEVLFHGRKHFVLRRSSEFQTLHRKDVIYQDEDVPQVLLDFLHVKHFHTGIKVSSMESLDDLDSQDYSYPLPNQRVLGFFQDPYVSDCTSGGTTHDLPDVVVDGVLQGFYTRDVRVSFTAPVLTKPDPPTSIEA